jgi:chromosomal replication initiation ATPase DnaA
MIRGISPSAQDKWVKKSPAPKAPAPVVVAPPPREAPRRPGPVKGFTIEQVRRIGRGLAGRQGRDFFRPAKIITEVIHKHGLTRVQLRSKCQTPQYVAARQELAYRLREELALSYPQIGEILGKDHSTIMHSCRRYAAKLAAEASNGG